MRKILTDGDPPNVCMLSTADAKRKLDSVLALTCIDAYENECVTIMRDSGVER